MFFPSVTLICEGELFTFLDQFMDKKVILLPPTAAKYEDLDAK